MTNISHEIKIPPVGFLDKEDFEVGMSFCVPLGEIIAGEKYRQSRKLPAHERQFKAMLDGSDPNEMWAEDTIVVVDRVCGHEVSVSDIYCSEDGEVVSGKPGPSWTLTPEGWSIPKHDLDRAEGLLVSMEDLVIGYFSTTDNISVGVLDRLAAVRKTPLPHKFLIAAPPSEFEQNRYYG